VHARVDGFFDPLEERLNALMADYPPEFLQQLDRFLGDVTGALEEHGRTAR
jgi:hypothetical protein